MRILRYSKISHQHNQEDKYLCSILTFLEPIITVFFNHRITIEIFVNWWIVSLMKPTKRWIYRVLWRYLSFLTTSTLKTSSQGKGQETIYRTVYHCMLYGMISSFGKELFMTQSKRSCKSRKTTLIWTRIQSLSKLYSLSCVH